MISQSNKINQILDNEQKIIIDSTDKYIYVSACPGSGKTYTVVKKIEQELSCLKEHQGIIACSFANEAATELKNRISKTTNISNSYIGTIDSLVKIIITTFVNRGLSSIGILAKPVIISETLVPSREEEKRNELNLITRFYDSNVNYKKKGDDYCKKWLEKLMDGKYEVSFPSYLFATKIVQLKNFNEYFSDRYPSIYIDEAQDLNYFQHKLIKNIKDNTGINITMVGDSSQSIYQFRGARPELFESLGKQGYKKYTIDVSIRCDPSIIFYANRIYNFSNIKDPSIGKRIKMIDNINLDFLTKLKGGTFILVEDGATAISIYEKFKNDFDIVYSKKLDDMPEDYNLNRDIIDELIKYYLNYDNINDKYKYPVNQLLNIISNINKKIKKQQLFINNRDIAVYLKDCLSNINIDITDSTLAIIKSKLEDEKYKYSYLIVDKDNRIMTIFGAKGLENDNVIIVLNNFYNKINEEFKNKLFVAITRAKNNVYIISENNNNVTNFVIKLLEV